MRRSTSTRVAHECFAAATGSPAPSGRAVVQARQERLDVGAREPRLGVRLLARPRDRRDQPGLAQLVGVRTPDAEHAIEIAVIEAGPLDLDDAFSRERGHRHATVGEVLLVLADQPGRLENLAQALRVGVPPLRRGMDGRDRARGDRLAEDDGAVFQHKVVGDELPRHGAERVVSFLRRTAAEEVVERGSHDRLGLGQSALVRIGVVEPLEEGAKPFWTPRAE